MGKELKHFNCEQCSWDGMEFYDPKNGFVCPSCGNVLLNGIENNKKIYHSGDLLFEKTTDGKPGIFLLNDGRWQFVCACGHGEIWSTKKLAEENYITHQKLHDLVRERKIKTFQEILEDIQELNKMVN